MLEWKRGRNLTKYGNVSYEYDAGGIRQKKTVNGTQYSYWTEGGTIHREYRSNGTALWYYYDSTGIEGFQCNGTRYHYFKNLQGDIVGIVDGNGKMAAAYRYDAWGNHKVYDGNFRERHDTDFIGNINPFRYRGYYYDAETGLYYLQSRYYDPAFGRFINADDPAVLLDEDAGIIGGLNLYAYCNNNPVMYVDPTGCFPFLAFILGITALVGMGLASGGVASGNNMLTAIGLTMVAVPALISGGIAVVAGIGGATLTGVVGGVTIAAGIGSSLFASAEYQEAITGNNWMLEAGMSENWYNGLMLTTAALATLGTLASSFCYNFNIKSIDGFGRYGKYGKRGYRGIRFQTGKGKQRVLTFHTHSHVPGKTISQWHWQLQKWNPIAKETAGTIAKWIWWLLTRIK